VEPLGDCPDFRAAKMGLSPSCVRERLGDCPHFREAKMGLSPSAQGPALLRERTWRGASSNSGGIRSAVGAISSRNTVVSSPASSNGSDDQPGWAISPNVVVPARKLSCNPRRIVCGDVCWPCRKWSMTSRIQSTKGMPGVPIGSGRSLNSRWVWALTRPGRMATLPRSSTGMPAGGSPTATIRWPRKVTAPSTIGSPATGKT